jgi:hypothetical protein
MILTERKLAFRSNYPPDEALARLRSGFSQEPPPPFRATRLQPFPRGKFLVGEFSGYSMKLRALDTTAVLRPVFEGCLVACEGGSSLQGSLRYDASAMTVVTLVVIHIGIASGLVFWSITHSFLLTMAAIAVVLTFIVERVRPAVIAQRDAFFAAIDKAGFRSEAGL